MGYERLIEDMKNYCKLNYPNIYNIEIIEVGFLEQNGVILNSKTKIKLNGRIEFDYIGGTPFTNYNKYFKEG